MGQPCISDVIYGYSVLELLYVIELFYVASYIGLFSYLVGGTCP